MTRPAVRRAPCFRGPLAVVVTLATSPRKHVLQPETVCSRSGLASDADDDLAEVGRALYVAQRRGDFAEREDAVDHRLHLVKGDRPVHLLEHHPAADVDAVDADA